jgi:hypothetical protein
VPERLGNSADKHHTQTSHYIREKRTTPPADEFIQQLIYPAAWGWTIAVVLTGLGVKFEIYVTDRLIHTIVAFVIKFI